MTASPSYALSVLPAAVEAAQRTASEYVAQALATAERVGYERGLAEQRTRTDTDGNAGLLTLLLRAGKALSDVESSGRSIDGYCDELTVTAKRRGKRVDIASVPDDGDTFADVARWLTEHGGTDLVNPDHIEIDADEVRNIGVTLAGECQAIRELLDEAIDRLTVAPQAETSAQRDARVGVITQAHADDVG